MTDKSILRIMKIIVGMIILFFYIKNLLTNKNEINKTESSLTLELLGEEMILISVGEEYNEPGYVANDSIEGDLTSKVSVQNSLDNSMPGTYVITYIVKNKNGEKIESRRYITVEAAKEVSYKDSYDSIDNKLRTWWSGNKKDNTRPEVGAGNTSEILKQYGAYYMGADEPTIYLTFDEGTVENYVDEIVDVLNKNNVKATFFLCGGFMKAKPELIKKISESGHSVGNHTANHATMPDLASRSNFEKYLKQIKDNEKIYEDITGQKMDKVYREPKGEYSYRSLQIVHDLGYKTFFWSADHYDFAHQVSKEKTLQELEKRYHNGAIYLLHSTNKGNYEALDDFIKNMKKLGYSFGLVKDIE